MKNKKGYMPTIKEIPQQYVLVIMSDTEGVIGFVCEREKERSVYEKDGGKYIRFPLKIYSSKEEANEAGDVLCKLIDGKSGNAKKAIEICEKMRVEFEPKPVLIMATKTTIHEGGEISMFVGELREEGIAIHSHDFYKGKDDRLYGDVSAKDTCIYFSYDEYIDMGDKLVELYGGK